MRKTWSVSRGPIAATPADVEKASAINAMLCEPIGILPKAPGDPIRPFSLGLFNHIKTRLRVRRKHLAAHHGLLHFLKTLLFRERAARFDAARHRRQACSATDRG